jgi:exosome complex RNA-binding protein Csl4
MLMTDETREEIRNWIKEEVDKLLDEKVSTGVLLSAEEEKLPLNIIVENNNIQSLCFHVVTIDATNLKIVVEPRTEEGKQGNILIPQNTSVNLVTIQ